MSHVTPAQISKSAIGQLRDLCSEIHGFIIESKEGEREKEDRIRIERSQNSDNAQTRVAARCSERRTLS
ncbi:hypothetical protein TNCV_635041 [Trichonephila clavipes]|nr:hypothetical protein TNCV_635041 [Trichonephila clavipes]